jgi:hypothetical protein
MLGGPEMTSLIWTSFSIGWLHATKAMSTDGYFSLMKTTSNNFIYEYVCVYSVEDARLSLIQELSHRPGLYWQLFHSRSCSILSSESSSLLGPEHGNLQLKSRARD